MADQDRLVVTPYNPRRQRQKLLLSIGVSIVCLFVGLLLGGKLFDWEMAEKRQLSKDYEELQQREQQLGQQLASAELNSQVDGAALETVRSELSKLQGALASSKEELSFYRNLLQREGVAQGLLINGFDLYRNDDTGDLNYRLIVQQRAGKLKTIKVTAKVQVVGLVAGEAKTLTLNTVDPEQNKEAWTMEFRYFYVHDGLLVLPEGFEAQNVLVQVWPAGQPRKKIEQQFDWKLEAEHSEEESGQ